VICPGKNGLNRAGIFGDDSNRDYIRELAHDFRGSVEPGKRFFARARSLVRNQDRAGFFKEMENPIQRIGSMNINLLRLGIKALKAGLVTVLAVEIEQYGVESFCSYPARQSCDNGGLSNTALAALSEYYR
jgi:hypothetical protein